MPRPNETIPDITLERFLLKELPPGQFADIEKRLISDEHLKSRLADLQNSNRELLEKFPARVEANIIRNKHHKLETQQSYSGERQQTMGWKKTSLVFSCAVALLLVWFTLVPWLQNTQTVQQGEERLKGLEPKLEIYLRKKTAPVKLKEGKLIRQGDVLQLKYRAAGVKFGTIISYDGLGNVTLHFPDTEADKPALKQKGFQRLSHAYELDDAPNYEKFVFITSQKEFKVTEALDHVKKYTGPDSNMNIEVPGGWQQQIITLVKEN